MPCLTSGNQKQESSLQRKTMRKSLLLVSSLLFIFTHAFAQTKTVTGKVTDARDGSPLIGVSVNVKGSKAGTTTDASGLFRLSVPENAVLIFSNVGFTDEQVTVGTSEMITMAMRVAQKNLQ